MDANSPNPRLILRALRKKKNVALAIQQNQNLLRERAEGRDADVPPQKDVVVGRERSGEIDNPQISLPGI